MKVPSLQYSSDEAPARLTPPLKWAGGKRWLIPHLKKIIAPYANRRLVEPFVGGMAIALGFAPERALLNDSNPHLVNFYTQLKSGLIIKRAMKNDRAAFLAARKLFNKLSSTDETVSKQAAGLFYYLNRTGFNGLCRFNGSGEFNVPFGKYSKINYKRDFSEYSDALKKWQFSCGDFEKLPVRKTDLLYVDPPYDVEFTTYSKGGFSWEDQTRLVAWLSRWSCPIVASNQATERIIKLYKEAGFTVELLSAPRRISSSGDRTPALEMLATKNICNCSRG